jgi:calcineurin-like phosphoesterase family protein
MGRIFLTSDLHFCHQREFLYVPRGFNTIQEHDEAVITRWNETVQEDDDVYALGDLMLNDNERGLECLRRLNGRIHLVRGNHDTDARWKLYSELENVVEMENVIIFKYRKYHFYLSHFPSLTANLEKESLHQCTLNLFGHTHDKRHFFEDRPYMYNVSLDAHNCVPVLLDDIIEEMKAKVQECVDML